jgi:hypothetical protein
MQALTKAQLEVPEDGPAGQAMMPAPQESGWKDTVVVPVNSTVRDGRPLCAVHREVRHPLHNLAHEDHAMMANFDVV